MYVFILLTTLTNIISLAINQYAKVKNFSPLAKAVLTQPGQKVMNLIAWMI